MEKLLKKLLSFYKDLELDTIKDKQYLSNFFELLLTTGLKQESGQAPVPIAQFIIKSLPLTKLLIAKLKRRKK